MIRNRKLDHIGLATNDVEATTAWYIDVLGYQLIGSFGAPGAKPVNFIQSGDLVYEIYQPDGGVDAPGKIDHISYPSDDIQADFDYCKAQGYQMEDGIIHEIPVFWEKGVRYFKLVSPTGEPIEFCQKL